MAPVADHEVSKSGITTSASGDRVIPASTRADGSQRREIRVRPGYRPPEDVEVYRNRTAEAWKTRGVGDVPGAEGLEDEKEGHATEPKTKNAKRREAKKRAKAAAAAAGATADGTPEEERETANEAQDPPSLSRDDQQTETSARHKEDVTIEDQGSAEAEKKIKRLKKKLREARELQARREKGEGLLQEQFDKVIKIRELIRDLEKLGIIEDDQ